jgi:anti-sigma factor RsiW
MTHISETELNAYVDGEAFPERQAVIEAWLARNRADAAKVKGWRRQNQTLRASFGRILSEPLPPSLANATLNTSGALEPSGGSVAMLSPRARAAPAPAPPSWDRRDRVALIAAGSFLAGAGVACLAGFLAGLQ